MPEEAPRRLHGGPEEAPEDPRRLRLLGPLQGLRRLRLTAEHRGRGGREEALRRP